MCPACQGSIPIQNLKTTTGGASSRLARRLLPGIATLAQVLGLQMQTEAQDPMPEALLGSPDLSGQSVFCPSHNLIFHFKLSSRLASKEYLLHVGEQPCFTFRWKNEPNILTGLSAHLSTVQMQMPPPDPCHQIHSCGQACPTGNNLQPSARIWYWLGC